MEKIGWILDRSCSMAYVTDLADGNWCKWHCRSRIDGMILDRDNETLHPSAKCLSASKQELFVLFTILVLGIIFVRLLL